MIARQRRSLIVPFFPSRFQEEEAKQLIRQAILGGIFNDMGSGSNVDLCVIKANDQVDYLRGYDVANVKGERKQRYEYKKGTTAVLETKVRPVVVEETVRHVGAKAEAMETE